MASRKKKKTCCGPVRIIHYNQDKTDCKGKQISESNFKKINEAAEVKKAQSNERKWMNDICWQVPSEYIPNLHGNYT